VANFWSADATGSLTLDMESYDPDVPVSFSIKQSQMGNAPSISYSSRSSSLLARGILAWGMQLEEIDAPGLWELGFHSDYFKK